MKSNEVKADKWYTVEEAAAYLGVTKQTIYNYMKAGLLPYYELKVGRGRRFRRGDLDSLLVRKVGEEGDASK